jgi:dTDP-4-amino-4,6-dideoxygalactose transaminase
MKRIPFLRPNLVHLDSYTPYLAQIDESRIYSNYGPLNTLFEQRLLNQFFAGRGALTTVANATLALMLAISLIRRPGGRYALMPSFTFAATPLAAMWCGLEPYFIDIEADSWCIDNRLVEQTLAELGTDVAVVVPYATFGTGTDLSYYSSLHSSGTPVVVDAAASVGTTLGNQHFGIDFPGAVIYSLHATKAFPIGEGGLVHSGDASLVAKLRQAANFGFTAARESALLGLNAKLSEFHAAVGLATIDQFSEKKSTRQQVYGWYRDQLDQQGLLTKGWGLQKTHGSIAHQFVPVLCPQGTNNLAVIDALDRANIEARTYFRPACHQQPSFSSFPRSSMAVTDSVAARSVSLPLWEEMPQSDVIRVLAALSTVNESK